MEIEYLESIDLDTLPSALMADWRGFPQIECVYFVISPDDGLVYIGLTSDLRQRWGGHKCRIIFRDIEGVKILWLTFPDYKLAIAAERFLIDIYSPELNLAPNWSKERNRADYLWALSKYKRHLKAKRREIRRYVESHIDEKQDANIRTFCENLLRFIDGKK